jgi:hypothetical protein
MLKERRSLECVEEDFKFDVGSCGMLAKGGGETLGFMEGKTA